MPSQILKDRLVADEMVFRFIDPPFGFNNPKVAAYPPEVTGRYLLDCMRRRFGWDSFVGKRLLDFGCGVRFARTIYNLDLTFGQYIGVDLHAEAIAWLQANLPDPRFRFEHLNSRNVMYNPRAGVDLPVDALAALGVLDCDGACMFSVITHQNPVEARLTFAQLRRAVRRGGALYFTAFIDETADPYIEADQGIPGHRSTHHPDALAAIVEAEGWRVLRIYPRQNIQAAAFVCG